MGDWLMYALVAAMLPMVLVTYVLIMWWACACISNDIKERRRLKIARQEEVWRKWRGER